MAFTYQSVIDLARIPLNDADKVRVSDETLMTFATQGMYELINRRPDLFIGQYGILPSDTNAVTDPFPLTKYVQLLADYVTFRAESIDDEKMNNGRALAFAQLFGSEAQP